VRYTIKPGEKNRIVYRDSMISAIRSGSEVMCYLCNKRIRYPSDFTVDHINPKSKGGASSFRNFAPAHEKCNKQKSNRVL